MGNYFDTRKFFKIYFSPNPDQFLGIEDQLRFIRDITTNPQAHFTFVYCKTLLNNDAHKNLLQFCANYKVTPIDINDHLSPRLQSLKDKLCLKFANEEIAMFKSKLGGNLVAAADLTRVIQKLLEEFGNYSDLDVALNFAKAPTKVAAISSFAIPSYEINSRRFDFNNDFIAPSYQSNKKLSDDAKNDLKLLQEIILNKRIARNTGFVITDFHTDTNGFFKFESPNVTNFFSAIFNKSPNINLYELRLRVENLTIKDYFILQNPTIRWVILGLTSIEHLSENELIKGFVTQTYLNISKKNPNIYLNEDFYMECLTELKKQLDCLKHSLSLHCVAYYAGPLCYSEFLAAKSNTFDRRPKREFAQKFSLNGNKLDQFVKSTNIPFKNDSSSNALDTIGDQTWGILGIEKKHYRETALEKNTILLQSAWRRYQCIKKFDQLKHSNSKTTLQFKN